MVCSDFWKLDKIDKIGISLIFILSAFFSCFSCFSFASENSLDLIRVDNISINNGIHITDNTSVFYYYPLEEGKKYRFTTNYNGTGGIYLINSLELGTKGTNLYQYVNKDFEYISDGSALYLGYSVLTSDIRDNTFFRCDIVSKSFSDVIGVLSSNVGIVQLFDIFEVSLPFVLIVVLVAFGFMIIFNIIKGLSKGKGRI